MKPIASDLNQSHSFQTTLLISHCDTAQLSPLRLNNKFKERFDRLQVCYG